jgi:hypothetical protein
VGSVCRMLWYSTGKGSFDVQAGGVGCWYVGITNYLVNFFWGKLQSWIETKVFVTNVWGQNLFIEGEYITV